MNCPGLAIFISGRGSNMSAVIDNVNNGILKGICKIDFVLSNVPEAPGLQTAEEKGVKTFVISSRGKSREEFENAATELVNKYKSKYIILAGFNRMLSEHFIRKYSNRIINIHPADTNLYQGLGGYKWAFNNNLEETKITVHFVDEGMDTGKIIKQKKLDLRGCSTLEDVEKKGIMEENIFYSQVIAELLLNSDKEI